MLQHVVLLRFPEPLGEPGRAELRTLLEPLAAEAEFIEEMRFGCSSTDWTGGYEYLLYVELTDSATLPDYLGHPRHVAVGQWMSERNCEAVVFDYTVDAATRIAARPRGAGS